MEAGAAPEIKRRGHFWLEITIATVLGLTAIATAYAAYKSSVHERETVAHYNEGIRESSLPTGVLLEAEQTISSDRALFLEYAKAAETGDKALAAYLLTGLMSHDLKAAVIWWSNHSNKYSTPFVAANPKWNDPSWPSATSSPTNRRACLHPLSRPTRRAIAMTS